MSHDEPDLLDVIAEIEHGPLPCPHNVGVRSGSGWSQELDPSSPYYAEWVHSDPNCRRSKFPGHKQPLPTKAWSKAKQQDVPRA